MRRAISHPTQSADITGPVRASAARNQVAVVDIRCRMVHLPNKTDGDGAMRENNEEKEGEEDRQGRSNRNALNGMGSPLQFTPAPWYLLCWTGMYLKQFNFPEARETVFISGEKTLRSLSSRSGSARPKKTFAQLSGLYLKSTDFPGSCGLNPRGCKDRTLIRSAVEGEGYVGKTFRREVEERARRSEDEESGKIEVVRPRGANARWRAHRARPSGYIHLAPVVTIDAISALSNGPPPTLAISIIVTAFPLPAGSVRPRCTQGGRSPRRQRVRGSPGDTAGGAGRTTTVIEASTGALVLPRFGFWRLAASKPFDLRENFWRPTRKNYNFRDPSGKRKCPAATKKKEEEKRRMAELVLIDGPMRSIVDTSVSRPRPWDPPRWRWTRCLAAGRRRRKGRKEGYPGRGVVESVVDAEAGVLAVLHAVVTAGAEGERGWMEGVQRGEGPKALLEERTSRPSCTIPATRSSASRHRVLLPSAGLKWSGRGCCRSRALDAEQRRKAHPHPFRPRVIASSRQTPLVANRTSRRITKHKRGPDDPLHLQCFLDVS
ncbi:hypothetical protein B0H13DRAFT_2266879 [Mycena leptocephala]|nr:hypothetical protein B0H13DRAFT_2266879 [Mycena leptocephala]